MIGKFFVFFFLGGGGRGVGGGGRGGGGGGGGGDSSGRDAGMLFQTEEVLTAEVRGIQPAVKGF